jgi:endoglucanase
MALQLLPIATHLERASTLMWIKHAWLVFVLMAVTGASNGATDWPLWKSYLDSFTDSQIRVIDHDAGDRTTSEGQAYAMFFALVADDRARFDGLLRWTEVNLAAGDLSTHLPAWLWGHAKSGEWTVLDQNSAADADVWMAYTLIEAGKAWGESRYTALGTALAEKIAKEEVVEIPDFGKVLLPGPHGFHTGNSYRLNASYLPLQLFLGLRHELPNGPWGELTKRIPDIVSASSPHGFASDWLEWKARSFSPSSIGSYDAIRVYLWAGLLDPATPGRDAILKALSGMTHYLHTNSIPPAKVKADGSVDDPKGPVGFSAALVPLLAALGENELADAQNSRLHAELDPKSRLYGKQPRYYDQNLALFAIGWKEHRFSFDSRGDLKLAWRAPTN